jgi:glycosyltransferase involved in cell wall biosynthesis
VLTSHNPERQGRNGPTKTRWIGGYLIGLPVTEDMRVAVVAIETAHHTESDANRRLQRLAELLVKNGHDLTVFCAKWWDGSPNEFEADGVTYRAVVDQTAIRGRRLLTALPGPLKAFDPEVIHAAHTYPSAVHAAKLASAVARKPLVVDWYDIELGQGWTGRAQRLAIKAPDIVITPSQLVQTAVRECGRAADDIVVIPNSVDMNRIRTIEPEALGDIVYSRVLDEHANLESLLLALAELRDVDWTTVVLGEGSERTRYEQQARELRIDDRVHFLGSQPLERRLAIFKGAHVAVHTAIRAPFATEFLNALACGCVGIAEYQAASSATELVEHFDRGFRATSDDQLVEAIRQAADLPHRAVDEHFAAYDESRILQQFEDCYRTVKADFGLF